MKLPPLQIAPYDSPSLPRCQQLAPGTVQEGAFEMAVPPDVSTSPEALKERVRKYRGRAQVYKQEVARLQAVIAQLQTLPGAADILAAALSENTG
jgi:hypothetical protein